MGEQGIALHLTKADASTKLAPLDRLVCQHVHGPGRPHLHRYEGFVWVQGLIKVVSLHIAGVSRIQLIDEWHAVGCILSVLEEPLDP